MSAQATVEQVPLPRVTFIDSSGESLTVEARVGDSVMETSKRHRLPGIRGDCGGFMMCATCHVYIDATDHPDLPPVSDTEDEMLDGTVCDRTESSRLACQLPITADTDLRVTLPARQI